MPEVVLTGAAGRIEGRYSAGKSETAPIALILHPHPKAGGQMNHPVAVQLFHLFMKRGFSVLRFNFRGVGRSQGEFDSGIGELADAATALDWLQATNPAASGRSKLLRRFRRARPQGACRDRPPHGSPRRAGSRPRSGWRLRSPRGR